MRVLLATDGSKEAATAMRAASRLLTRTDREMHVLHVAAEPRLGYMIAKEFPMLATCGYRSERLF